MVELGQKMLSFKCIFYLYSISCQQCLTKHQKE